MKHYVLLILVAFSACIGIQAQQVTTQSNTTSQGGTQTATVVKNGIPTIGLQQPASIVIILLSTAMYIPKN